MEYSIESLAEIINITWDERDNHAKLKEAENAIFHLLSLLDQGLIRVCTKKDGQWVTHQWVKKAILLSFHISSHKIILGAPGTHDHTRYWYDKVGLKYDGYTDEDFQAAQVRAVPGALVRYSAFISPHVVLMPSFVNVGAWVGPGTMVDTWSTIGSCAQIGAHCHISGGVGIGGVLEPLQANPVIIEDNCFIGARSEIAEGVLVQEGAVIGMGVFIGASTKIVDRQTGQVTYGTVPPYSVVVSGTYPSASVTQPAVYCAVIIKKVDEKTRQKTSLNELLRP